MPGAHVPSPRDVAPSVDLAQELVAASTGAAGLDRDQTSDLLRAQGARLAALLLAANALRDDTRPRVVTYSRKVFIPLTNLCRDKCGYCTFARAPSDPTAHLMTPDEVLAIARAGQAQGCKEALFSLGEKPEERYGRARRDLRAQGYATTTAYLAAMCQLVYQETGLLAHVNCGVLDAEEISVLREVCLSLGLMLESSSPRLLERGQAHYGCPGKVPEERLRTLREAVSEGLACTSGLLIGIGETIEERADTLLALRDLQQETGGIQEVIVQNFREKADIRMRGRGEPSALEMLRTLAVARLVLGPRQNIQAPPNLSPDVYATYLLAGINDWGGVSPVTRDHINPEHAWPLIDELGTATKDAGYRLRERLCLYPEYLSQEQFVRPLFRARVADLVDETGLVREAAPEESRA